MFQKCAQRKYVCNYVPCIIIVHVVGNLSPCGARAFPSRACGRTSKLHRIEKGFV